MTNFRERGHALRGECSYKVSIDIKANAIEFSTARHDGTPLFSMTGNVALMKGIVADLEQAIRALEAHSTEDG